MGTFFDDIGDMERRAITWLIMAIFCDIVILFVILILIFDDIEDMESMRRAITWLIMAISPLCSNSRETLGTSGENYIEKDCGGERGNAEI